MARRMGREYWRKHVETWYRSGLTQREYCTREGLHERAFYRWRRREGDSVAEQDRALTLVPVRVGDAGTPMVVRLQSPGGWTIELADGSVPWLGEFLRQLR
jgi:hypothetical protein